MKIKDKIKLGLSLNNQFEEFYKLIKDFYADSKALPKEGIMQLLRDYSSIRLDAKTDYAHRRSIRKVKKKLCFVCKVNNANCNHHIILIKNGGYSCKLNTISICNTCHKEIHPWMGDGCIASRKIDNEYATMFCSNE